MPWIVGIDEAGYGPNLGPFVMASSACRIDGDPQQIDLWYTLSEVACRSKDRVDGRLLIDDSKAVYSPAKGLKNLERGVLATMAGVVAQPSRMHDAGEPPALRHPSPPLGGGKKAGGPPAPQAQASVRQLVEFIASSSHPTLAEEIWYHGETRLPISADARELCRARERFHRISQNECITWAAPKTVIICPERFNGLIDRWKSKGIVLLVALAELVRNCLSNQSRVAEFAKNSDAKQGRNSGEFLYADSETMHFFIDKHGGRNNYREVLQECVPEGNVVACYESADCSDYRIDGLDREVRLTFRPRADAGNLCVALASMTAKYLREILMHEFNQYWQRRVPELKPTAGYPVDARRFWTQIHPIVTKEGIAEERIWRRK